MARDCTFSPHSVHTRSSICHPVGRVHSRLFLAPADPGSPGVIQQPAVVEASIQTDILLYRVWTSAHLGFIGMLLQSYMRIRSANAALTMLHHVTKRHDQVA